MSDLIFLAITGVLAGCESWDEEAKAEGQINEIRRLVAKGRLTVDAARAEIRELVEGGMISQDNAAKVLGQLG